VLEELKPPTTIIMSMPSGVPCAPVSLYTASWRYCGQERVDREAGDDEGAGKELFFHAMPVQA